MEEQFIQQLKGINYKLGHIINPQDLYSQLNGIKDSLDGLNNSFILYQSKITNQPWFQFIIGSFVTLIATLLLEYLKNRKAKKEHLYFLERVIVDQINMFIDARDTIKKFLEKISTLLKNIDSNPNSAYSVDGLFFPLFSIRSLPEEVNMKPTGSGYIDNKIGKIYALSKDSPHIINDVRLQLRDTMEKNEKISFGKLNSPEAQKEQFKRNIKEFEKMIKDEILGVNIPLYLKKLSETLVAVRAKSSTNSFIWRLKFNPKYKFFWKKSQYIKAKETIMEDMDEYFKIDTEKQLDIINKA